MAKIRLTVDAWRWTCQRCGGTWDMFVVDRDEQGREIPPRHCRLCGSKLWNTPRVRKEGGGRPKGSKEKGDVRTSDL